MSTPWSIYPHLWSIWVFPDVRIKICDRPSPSDCTFFSLKTISRWSWRQRWSKRLSLRTKLCLILNRCQLSLWGYEDWVLWWIEKYFRLLTCLIIIYLTYWKWFEDIKNDGGIYFSNEVIWWVAKVQRYSDYHLSQFQI